ncbi:MAG TPA: hypothetical protein PLF21_03855 [Exilispira sp.]|nr:hypothetical protein [Exilispira sp.]
MFESPRVRLSFIYFIKKSETRTTKAPTINTTSYPTFTQIIPPKIGITTAAI